MYVQFDPPEQLKHAICFFYAMEHDPADGPLQTLLPSGTCINGWQYSGKWRVHFNGPIPVNDFLLPEYYVVGQQTCSYRLTAEEGVAGIFGAALQPGTLFYLTQQSTHLFTNAPENITQVLPGNYIQPFIASYSKLTSNEQRYELLVSFYNQFVIPDNFAIYKRAVQIIFQAKGCISTNKLCEQLHVNERYLQREFRKYIGVSPSAYLNLMRFNNIFTELSLSKEKQNLENLALLFNYYDLSHFNKAYKSYFGMAPSAFLLDEFKLLKELISKDPYLLQVQYRNAR